MIEPQFSHDPFDALLADACRAAAREDLSCAGLRGRPAPRKLLRVLLIAALLAALLTFGVLASWPELRLWVAGDRLALSAVQGTEAAPAGDPEIRFGPLPDGVSVSPVEARNGAAQTKSICQITVQQDTYLLTKTCLGDTVFLGSSGGERALQRFQKSTRLVSGVDELTANDLTGGHLCCWPTDDAYYILVTAADPAYGTADLLLQALRALQ